MRVRMTMAACLVSCWFAGIASAAGVGEPADITLPVGARPTRMSDDSVRLDSGRFGLGGEYSLFGVGARAAALGNAFVGVADDASAIYWNPGGLGQVKLIGLSGFHAILDGAYYNELAYVQPALGIGTLGVELLTLTDLNYRVYQAGEVLPLHDTILSVGLGRELWSGLSAGLALKGYTLSLGPETAAAFGLDAGLFYRSPWPALAAGVVLADAVPPSLSVSGEEEAWARQARAGLSLTFWDGALLLTAEADRLLTDHAIWLWGAGLEAKPWPLLTVRFGARSFGEKALDLTAGLGLDLRDVRVDYAAVLSSGVTHRLSVSLVLGTYNARLKVEPKTFSRTSLNKTCSFGITLPDGGLIRNWQLLIRQNATGKPVKTATEPQLPAAVVWDGKDEQNNFLPEGQYTAELVGTDAEGNMLRSNLVEVSIQEPVVIKVTTQKDEPK